MSRALTWILLVGLAVLVCLSIHLSATRCYQVDECFEVAVAKILASGQAKSYAGNLNLGLLQFPLACAIRGASRAADFFLRARFFMLGMFWLNVVLIVLATGERLLSRRGLFALVGAATLAPLWDYGIEVRHDNLLLTGMLLTWITVRVHPKGVWSYLIAGSLAIAMQFAAHKAFVYTIPLSLAILAFPPPGHNTPRWKLALAWTSGALATILALYVVYAACGAPGIWNARKQGLDFVSKVATGGGHAGPWFTLFRLLYQTPLLLTLVVAAIVAVAADVRRRGRAALAWDGMLPEALFFVGTLAALAINPRPFVYNLVHLVPYAFIFAFRYGLVLCREVLGRPNLLLLAGTLLIFVHLGPFGIAVHKLLDWPNSRQTFLMTLAEGMTDPLKDPVFDGVGMVLTRPAVHPRLWVLHSLTLESVVNGPGPRTHDLLAERPPAVFIPNYRTDWLPDKDLAFIREHYVPLADDFWVLGNILASGGGTFEIIHPGRYCVSSLPESDLEERCRVGAGQIPGESRGISFTATLDGVPVSARPMTLTAGRHRLECTADCQPTVVWAGPRRDRAGRLNQSDHRALFVNWW
jgi:hypothetical protein